MSVVDEVLYENVEEAEKEIEESEASNDED